VKSSASFHVADIFRNSIYKISCVSNDTPHFLLS
jgi:hypothetical protein